MPSNAAYLLYGKIPIPSWEIMYPGTETCIRNKASFGSGPQCHPTPHAPSPYLRAVATLRRARGAQLYINWWYLGRGALLKRATSSPLSRLTGIYATRAKRDSPPEWPSAHQGLRSMRVYVVRGRGAEPEGAGAWIRFTKSQSCRHSILENTARTARIFRVLYVCCPS
jgi:hypothetical protein